MVTLTVEHLERMRIPEVFWDCKMSRIPSDCKHRDVLIGYVSAIVDRLTDGVGLLLWGPYGHGKSGLAAILLKAAASRKRIGLWLKVSDLPTLFIKDTVFDSEQTMLERAKNVPLLVLDEFIIWGDRRDWYFESIIRDRVSSRLTTIVTTNLEPSKILGKYPALGSVIKEAVCPVFVSGYDFRSEKGDSLAKVI